MIYKVLGTISSVVGVLAILIGVLAYLGFFNFVASGTACLILGLIGIVILVPGLLFLRRKQEAV